MRKLDDQYERELPHSIQAEQSVIGSVLINESFDVADRLLEDHFFDKRHSSIFGTMRDLSDNGKSIDLVSLTARLQERHLLGETGGVSYLTQLAQMVPRGINIDSYVDTVKDRYIHRETIRAAQNNLRIAWEAETPQIAIAEMQIAATSLNDQAAKKKEFRSTREVAMEVFEKIEYRYAHFGDDVTGIPSGFSDLDRMTSGFQSSDLIIIAARPSVGKTALALNIAQNVGIRTKSNVAIFSLEMPAEQLVQRMMSADQNIDATKLRTGCLTGDDWERLTMAVGTLSESQIFIDDSAVLTAHEIAAKCRRLHKTEGLNMIVIDYLQLIAGRGKRNENRQQEVSEISRTLKQLARELDVPVIALSQLSRAVEQRQDKRPMLSDLRESGSIEQDADIVAFLYREDYYDKESERKNIIEIIIAKHRNGPIGTVELVFLKNFNKFVSLDRSHQSAQPDKLNKAIPDMYRGS